MLLCQYFRRGHEGAHAPAFPRLPDERRRDKGLAAADVALQKPVHHAAGAHVRRGLAHGAPLCAGGGEGEGGVELLKIALIQPYPALAAALSAHHAKRRCQHEKLLKYQPPPRKLQRGEVGREVYVFIGVVRLHKLTAPPHALGQHVRRHARARGQTLLHALYHHALAQPRAQPVHRDYPPRHAVFRALFFVHGVHHAPAPAAYLHAPVEDVRLPAHELILDVVLVEVGYIHRRALIHGAQLHKLHPAPYAHEARRVRHDGANAHGLVRRRLRDGAVFASVLVPARKI